MKRGELKEKVASKGTMTEDEGRPALQKSSAPKVGGTLWGKNTF